MLALSITLALPFEERVEVRAASSSQQHSWLSASLPQPASLLGGSEAATLRFQVAADGEFRGTEALADARTEIRGHDSFIVNDDERYQPACHLKRSSLSALLLWTGIR